MESETWTNEQILNEFLEGTVKHIYTTASAFTKIVQETALEDNPNRVRELLISIQIGVVASCIFAYINRSRGPDEWPGIELVNAETGKPLSDDLARDFSRVEGEYIERNE